MKQELRRAGKKTTIADRIEAIANEDSDGDGVPNLIELLTGHHPYRTRSLPPQEIFRLVCGEEPEKPSTIISRTEEIDGRGLVLQPTLFGPHAVIPFDPGADPLLGYPPRGQAHLWSVVEPPSRQDR